MKNVRHSRKMGGVVDKKSNKKWRRGGVTAKKSDATHSKKQDFASDVLFE